MSLEEDILRYCKNYNVPVEYFLEILNDQKVLPMIRGKASEYMSYLVAKKVLPKTEWVVTKLNLNPQTNTYDQDVSITHRRTGVTLKLETKSAVRGSFSSGVRARICKEPHFKVKCHRSRSNVKLAETTNDKYAEDCFDVVISNVSNAIIQPNTIGDCLELLHDRDRIEILKKHYGVDNDEDLLPAAYEDWRFAISKAISVDGYIPRTPYVKLSGDQKWHGLDMLEETLLERVEAIRRR